MVNDARHNLELWTPQTDTPRQGIVQTPTLTLYDRARQYAVSTARFGARLKIHKFEGEWCLAQSAPDNYIGWAQSAQIAMGEFAEKSLEPPANADRYPMRIFARSSFIFSQPDIKSPVLLHLSKGSTLNAKAYTPLEGAPNHTQTEHSPQFHIVDLPPNLYGQDHGFIFSQHLTGADLKAHEHAFMLLGTPYLWGGNSAFGIDCSGLVQLAHSCRGEDVPRDSDEQFAASTPKEFAKRCAGDWVFWKGHIAIMIDKNQIIHATAFALQTIIEPLEQAMARIGEPIGIHRPSVSL